MEQLLQAGNRRPRISISIELRSKALTTWVPEVAIDLETWRQPPGRHRELDGLGCAVRMAGVALTRSRSAVTRPGQKLASPEASQHPLSTGSLTRRP